MSIFNKWKSRLSGPTHKLAYAVLIGNVVLLISVISLSKTHTFHANYIYDQLNARLGFSNLFRIPEIIGYQLRSSFTDIKEVNLNMTPEDAAELERMRAAAMNDDKAFEYVNGQISVGDETIECKIRSKGDRDIHYDEADKMSYRIKLKGGTTIMGMKIFSMHKPRARNYLDEWIFLQMMREEGLITPRYEFVNLTVNGDDKGLYVAEEHYTKHLIERNGKKEGPILKFDEDVSTDFRKTNILVYENRKWSNPAQLALKRKAVQLVEGFRKGELSAADVFDVKQMARFFAVADLCAARHGTVVKSLRFYYNPITSKLEPIPFDGHRGTSGAGYYLLAQIGIDAKENWIHNIYADWYKEWFNREDRYSEEFYSEYIRTLERISKRNYLIQFFERNETEIERLLELIYSEFPGHDNIFSYGPFPYYFSRSSYYQNQQHITRYLTKPKLIANLITIEDTSVVIDVTNNHVALPYELLDLTYKKRIGFPEEGTHLIIVENSLIEGRAAKRVRFNLGGMSKAKLYRKKDIILSFRHPGSSVIHTVPLNVSTDNDITELSNDVIRRRSNMDDFDFIENDRGGKVATIKAGSYDLDKSLIIPAGYTFKIEKGVEINLVNKSLILSYSPLLWIGTEEEPIEIKSSEADRGQGLLVMGAPEKSFLSQVRFSFLGNPDTNDWSVPGSVTFYESDVRIDGSTFHGNVSEDGLNIIRSNFSINHCDFHNTFSDALDIDFGVGEIFSCIFSEISNDAVDVSGTTLKMDSVHIKSTGDKGLSVGEQSKVNIKNMSIKNTEIAITSKDNSEVFVTNIDLENCKLGYAVFQKKSEYGSAKLRVNGASHMSVGREHAVEVGSSLVLNNEVIKGTVNDVVLLLNGNEYGAKTIK